MSTATTASPTQRQPELLGQTVVVIGGNAGIGLEKARRARVEGARLILTGRNREPLQRTAGELDALTTAAFDATDPEALERLSRDSPATIDDIMVTAGSPYYPRLADLDRERAHRNFDEHLWLPSAVAPHAVGRVRPAGTLRFMGGTGGREREPGLSLIAAGSGVAPSSLRAISISETIRPSAEPGAAAGLLFGRGRQAGRVQHLDQSAIDNERLVPLLSLVWHEEP